MGNKFGRKGKTLDPDVAWKLQNKEMAENPMYKFADLARGGRLVKIYEDHGPERVKEVARTEMVHYLYNGGKGGHVSRLDYLRWSSIMHAKATGTTYKEQKEADLEAEFVEDKFNKFEAHEACWDLFQRGGVGETPFHLCYLMDTPVHFEVGKALLEVFPKLALDYYEGEEYFGESSLHIAVILGDMDAVHELVKYGANVHQRATGRFFLPEDQKNNPVKETNYSGYCYYGEYPLAFAACRGNVEVYDYLIDHGADPNAQDSFGNTILHMVVIHEQSELFRHAVRHHKLEARTDILNKQNLTPLTLASKLGRSHIFKDMLDLGSMEMWRFSNTSCSVYPLAALDSIGPGGGTNWHSALMIIVNGETDEHLDMLEGGVIRQLLDDKWKTFARRRFIERLIIAFIHLIMLSVAIYTRPIGDKLLQYNGITDAVRYFCEVMVCASCLLTCVLEVIEIWSQGMRTFLKNCAHAPDQTVYLLSCLLVLACIPCRLLHAWTVEDILLIIAAPGSWFFLLFFARGARLTGPFVTMIYRMLSGDLFRFAIIYIIFLMGFTLGFFFLFRDVTSDNGDVLKFSTLMDTVLNLFQMTLGEFKYEAFNYSRYSPLTKIVFALFMLLMPILLLNMLIAMMGNTYNQVIAKSEKEWRRQWAKIVVVLERGYSKKRLIQFQSDYSIKLAQPPKHQLGEFGAEVEQRALVVIKQAAKSRAKTTKTAIVNWKRLGKEVVRQQRDWRNKGQRGAFKVDKRRGTVALEDMGMFNLSGAVSQLAWEKDMDFDKGASPRSPGAEQGGGEGGGGGGGGGFSFGQKSGTAGGGQQLPSTTLAPPPPTAAAAALLQVNGGPAGGQRGVVEGQGSVPNGSVVQRSQHQRAVKSSPARRAKSLVYNRVAPLLPPLPPPDRSAESPCAESDDLKQGERSATTATTTTTTASVTALDLKSISSWGDPETPRSLLSPKKEPGLGGFLEADETDHSPPRRDRASLGGGGSAHSSPRKERFSPRKERSSEGFQGGAESGPPPPLRRERSSGSLKDVEDGQYSPRPELAGASGAGVKDGESGVVVQSAVTHSELSPDVQPSPQRSRRRHKKKKSKDGKRSREGTPQKSTPSTPPTPPPTYAAAAADAACDFDSLRSDSQGRDSQGQDDRDGSHV